ncbi:MAG: hypothetical protein QE263_00655 [Vampirovibrionales bacterium]|nr:hypothetical protein [Vampirovibrionales bacterium]
MSVYGSFPAPSGYGYNSAPTSVVVPPLPNDNNYYQLPDVIRQGGTTEVNRHYEQDVYYNDKVIVTNHVVVCPCGHDTGKRYQTYQYVPPTTQLGALRSWTEGAEPPIPQVNTSYGNGGVQLPYSDPQAAANPQNLLPTLWSSFTSLLSTLQQWGGAY